MDAHAKKLLRQLKQHRKEAATYEKARVKMIEKEHRALGLTDTVLQKELKAIGVDVKALLKDTAVEARSCRKCTRDFSRWCDHQGSPAILSSKFLPTRMYLT
jgi:hypothetical protein